MHEQVASGGAMGAPLDLRARIDEAFSPSAPVTRREFFAGRQSQLQSLIQVILQRGQHAIVHGERGVGKTSLVQVLAEFTQAPITFVRVGADSGDTYTSLWRKVSSGIRFLESRPSIGFSGEAAVSLSSADALLGAPDSGPVHPGDVVGMLHALTSREPMVVVIDEFDRVTDPATRAAMADTIKTLSDQSAPVTLVLVGISEEALSLLAAHPSIERAIVPIHVPRMTDDELEEAFGRAMTAIGMDAEPEVVGRLVTIVQGLPHYLHLLGQAAARAAATSGTNRIGVAHLDAAIAVALRQAHDVVRTAYEQSIVRARRGIYPEILLACALAPRDVRGTFGVLGARDALEGIVRREVRGLTNQIAALCEDGRGSVLQKLGAGKTARYRFVNPLLQPYILMRGLEQGWATRQTPAWLTGELRPWRKAA